MQTHEIISIKESELVSLIKTMDTEALEKHARNIMKDMGSTDYAGIMGKIMKTMKEGQNLNLSPFERVQNLLKDNLPNEAYMSDIYARLATLVMIIISRKFNTLYEQKK